MQVGERENIRILNRMTSALRSDLILQCDLDDGFEVMLEKGR